MEKIYESKYHELEKSHFWFLARRQFVRKLLSEIKEEEKVLDIGCSSGALLEDLQKQGCPKESLYGVDISKDAIRHCRVKGIKNTFVMDAAKLNLGEQFDRMIASDCLEHIENDEQALASWRKALNPSRGLLYVFVPAFQLLWSQHDEINMHYRRYTRSSLCAKLEKKGFDVLRSGYWNSFLFAPVALDRLLGRLNRMEKENKTGDLEKKSYLNALFLRILRFENSLQHFVNFPVGLSTYCVARRK